MKKTIHYLLGAALILFGVGLLTGIISLMISSSENRDFIEYANSLAHSEIQGINALEVDVSYGRLNIIRGDELRITATGVKEDEFSCEIENSVIRIRENSSDASVKLLGWRFPEDILYRTLKEKTPEIIIQIPESLTLSVSVICLNSGELSVSDFRSEKTVFQIGAGTANIKKCTIAGSANIQLGIGNMILSDVEMNNSVIECGIGDISVNGVLSGNSTVNCSAGNISILLDELYNRYNFNLQCNAGGIDIENRTFAGLGLNTSYTSGKEKETINISCSIGKILLK